MKVIYKRSLVEVARRVGTERALELFRNRYSDIPEDWYQDIARTIVVELSS